MKEIASKENKLYKTILKLGSKKQRDLYSLYIIEGPNIIKEALNCDLPPTHVIFSKEVYDDEHNCEIAEIIKILTERKIPVSIFDDKLFKALSFTETSQGVLGIAKKSRWNEDAAFEKGNFIVLDRLQDPGNVGTILRTADAAGYAGAILMKGSGDIYSPKTVRAAAGSLFRLPAVYMDSPKEVLEFLNKLGKTIICADGSGELNYYKCPMKENIALIIGNEGNGICGELLAGCHKKVKIPMRDQVDSLNAGVAAGILIYESVRE